MTHLLQFQKWVIDCQRLMTHKYFLAPQASETAVLFPRLIFEPCGRRDSYPDGLKNLAGPPFHLASENDLLARQVSRDFLLRGEIVKDVAPFEAAVVPGEAPFKFSAKQNRQKTAEYVTPDRSGRFVVDRSGVQPGFHSSEYLLNHPETFVLEGNSL